MTNSTDELKPRKSWGPFRHNNGYICCGTLRVARADFDTNPPPEIQKEILDDLCYPRPAPADGELVDVNVVAQTLIDAWEKAENEKVNVSYISTFVDMARAIQALQAKQGGGGDKAKPEQERVIVLNDRTINLLIAIGLLEKKKVDEAGRFAELLG